MRILRHILFPVILLAINFAFGQNQNLELWNSLAENDIRLQPEYGNAIKSEAQKEADNQFIAEMMKYYKTKEEAAEEMIKLGMDYLYERGDFETAMQRFNQAWLLDKNNPDIYYGYGTVYFNLGAFEEARQQYDKGLKLNPKHSEILTDYGTTYLGEYHSTQNPNYLTLAKTYLEEAKDADNKNSDAIYKLSIVHLYMDDCKSAKSYLKQAKKLRNPNVTPAYEKELNDKCDN